MSLRSHWWGRDITFDADEQKLVRVAEPVASSDAILLPDHMGLVVEAPRAHHHERMREHRRRRPQKEHAIFCGDRRHITGRNDLGARCRVVVIRGAIEAGLAGPWLEPPFGVGEDDAVFLRGERVLTDT